MAGFNVRAEARTYLNRNNNGNSNGKSEKQIPFEDDNKKDNNKKDNNKKGNNKKGNSTCFPSHSF